MLDLKKLIATYSFWTGNGRPVSIEKLNTELKKTGLGFTLSKNYISNPDYDCVFSADGTPLVLMGFHKSDSLPAFIKNGTAKVKEDHISQFHYDLLFTPALSLLPSIASLSVLQALFRFIDGISLDLKAQRILTEKNINDIISLNKFRVEDFVSIHFINDENNRGWVHTHGMEKFGLLNLETFDLKQESTLDCIQLFNDIMDLFLKGTPVVPNSPVKLTNGVVTLMYSYDVRPYLPRKTELLIKEHQEDFYSLIDFETVGDISEAVEGYFIEKRLGKNIKMFKPEEVEFPVNRIKELPLKGYQVFIRGRVPGESDPVFAELMLGRDGNIHYEILLDSIFNPTLQKGNLLDFDSLEIDYIIPYQNGKNISFEEISEK
ncbi:MAG: hypothetical protein JXR95_10515 [Deltaproteobacteria bacterium]|nr:hypothetical protein [Deltaproteobacteria bacterium]